MIRVRAAALLLALGAAGPVAASGEVPRPLSDEPRTGTKKITIAPKGTAAIAFELT